MNDQTDSQLLRAYAEHRSEPSFAELVRRHVDFVYSAALRMVCDSHLAEDVTQGVFVALAKNAAQLADRPVLSGWLHRTAQNIAAQTVRTDVRRRAREQEAAAMNELLSAEPDAVWKSIAPHLDTALGELSEPDRDALLLRYFERKSAHEMAQALGIGDEAAQKRVSRAVERLREYFSKRNVTIGASGLAVLISANAVQSAPIGLAAAISAAAILAGTTVSTSTAIAATKTIAMTALQKTLVTATVAVLAGVGIYEARQASQLREQNQTLRQQQAALAEQIRKLQQERDDATNRLASFAGGSVQENSNNLELLKLRGEVGVLRRQLALGSAKTVQQATPSRPSTGTVSKPGSYIAKEQLVNAGFDMPEAATETYLHAMWSRDFQQFTNAISSKMLAELQALNDPKKQEEFERKFREQDTASAIQGIQLLAKKVSDDRVDVEVLVFEEGKPPGTLIVKMVKEAGSWKFDGHTSDPNWKADWQDGHFENLIPAASQ